MGFGSSHYLPLPSFPFRFLPPFLSFLLLPSLLSFLSFPPSSPHVSSPPPCFLLSQTSESTSSLSPPPQIADANFLYLPRPRSASPCVSSGERCESAQHFVSSYKQQKVKLVAAVTLRSSKQPESFSSPPSVSPPRLLLVSSSSPPRLLLVSSRQSRYFSSAARAGRDDPD